MTIRSSIHRGVCLAALICGASAAFAQQSLPTIDIGGVRRAASGPRPASPPGVVNGAPASAAPASSPIARRESVFDRPPGQAVTTLDTKTVKYIEQSPQRGLDDLLRFSPGVAVTSLGQGGEAIISIRGSASNPNARAVGRNFALRDIVVLSDGFPITSADGFARTSVLDPHAFGNVAVYRGPSSALLGNYAIFGGIDFKSYTGAQIDGVEIGSEGGNFGYVNNFVRAGKHIVDPAYGEFDISVFGSDNRLEGYVPHRDSEAQTLNLLAKWAPTASDRFTVKYMFNNSFGNQNGPFSLFQFFNNPYQRGYGCPYAANVGSAFCVVRTAPRNGVWGIPNQPGNPAGLLSQSYESLVS